MKSIILLLVSLTAAPAFGGERQVVIEFAASKGTVVFNHTKHVKLAAGACTACHKGKPGQIDGFKKELAHTLCIGCHEPSEGNLEGPVSCPGCHGGKP
jgi:predicted CXXCH cytochrome family protein